MDLRQIKYFMLIYEYHSFSAAARKANVAQPALSTQIRHLEEELGIVLFARNSGGIVPTVLGRAFYELCTPIRENVDFARQRIAELAARDQINGPLRCGFPPSFFRHFLGKVIAEFSELYPDLELSISEAYGGTLKEWVREGTLDFAIGGWDETDTSLEGHMLFAEELVLVSGRPVFGKPFSRCDLRAYDGYKLMIPLRHQLLGPILQQYLANRIIRPLRTMVIDSYLGVLETARASDWVALIPISGVLDESMKSGLYIYPVAEPSLKFRWYLTHQRGMAMGLAARLLIARVTEEMAQAQQTWEKVLRREGSDAVPSTGQGADHADAPPSMV